ncbi:VPLPA-CTERM sorting domain-containing protein [Methylobacter psychrophilus]|uniref:VPLPA-CTERM sorting domain-containing protein n=1 Tax=Methylobacter psychrophilus TaxID=96941 RepID=UPI0021D4FBA0|nr:VPLPA-CTERM sorting domain-containing protein [Methylobacter psychrophilus]
MLSPISEASSINYTFFGVTRSSQLAGEVFSPLFSYDNLTLSNSSIGSSGSSFNPKNPAFDLYTAIKQSNGISESTANFYEGLFTGLNYSSNIITGRPTLSQINKIQSPPASAPNKPTSNQTVTRKSGGGNNSGGASGGGGSSGGRANTTSNPVNFSIVAPSLVPVPAAIWLFGSGLVIFGVINRRKRQTPL